MTTDDYYGPYQAALEEDWDYIKNYFKKNPYALINPLSAARDNAFQVAVFSNSKQPLEYLLGIAKEGSMAMYAYLEKNEYGDTALHEGCCQWEP
ncbi:hypothetical protein Patl1_09849 [Pistacia atlantica]|uniref:Uncharacterized protein n=1 Tax=Pistacia atlantica TaxID=434234 RepID=A0ACC1A468_9ROSI|nr:hypothetical protein Patl1_09849 [Pistacia atlantica]